MSLEQKIDGVLVTGRIRMNAAGDTGMPGWPNAAWYCEPVMGGVVIDDPDGDLDLEGWHTYTADETSCSKPRIFSGWITGRKIRRGKYKSGPSREWDVTIIDINEAAHLQTFRSSADSLRPAETDVERVQAALASSAMAGVPVADNGRLNTSGALNLTATNFVTEYPVDMLNNAAGQTAKNVYLYWDDSAGEISIHYDLVGTGPAATIGFSNVEADVDGSTVFFPLLDGELEMDPQGEYTGVLLMTAAGNFYGQNAALIDALTPTEFSPDSFQRDLVERSDRISKVATAEAYLTKLLDIHGHEVETLTFTTILPADAVNLALAGDVITPTFTHLPGFEAGDLETTIIRRTVAPLEGRRDMYVVHYECSNDASIAVGAGGGDPGGVVVPPRPPGSHWWEGSFDIPGDGRAYSGTTRDGFLPDSDYTFSITVAEESGPIHTYSTNVCPQTDLTGPGHPNSPDLAIDTPSFVRNVSGNMQMNTHAPGGDTEVFAGTIHTHSTVDPTDIFDMRGTTSDGDHSGTHSTLVSFWFDPVISVDPADPPSVFQPGQPVADYTPSPVPDGVTTIFTITPYVSGSLQVFVDNQNETAAILTGTGHETDAEDGTFELAFAPTSSERIRVNYTAAP